jgi:hypothetical protein
MSELRTSLYTHLDQEQPPPTRVPLNTPHMQNAIREEGREDICNAHGGPEKAETHGQLVVLIEV